MLLLRISALSHNIIIPSAIPTTAKAAPTIPFPIFKVSAADKLFDDTAGAEAVETEPYSETVEGSDLSRNELPHFVEIPEYTVEALDEEVEGINTCVSVTRPWKQSVQSDAAGTELRVDKSENKPVIVLTVTGAPVEF